MNLVTRNRLRYLRGLAPPLVLWVLFVAAVTGPVLSWMRGDERYDEGVLREWIMEARVFRDTLPELARDYLALRDSLTPPDEAGRQRLLLKAEKISEHLQALGNPPTKMYQGQLPLFPVIYRLEVGFDAAAPVASPAADGPSPGQPPVAAWDSGLPRHPSQFQELVLPLSDRSRLLLQYQLHAYNRRQQNEQAAARRLRWVTLFTVVATMFSALWVYLVQRRERERERKERERQAAEAAARQQIELAERRLLENQRLLLENELQRREAERRQEDAERKLLEQELATQAAERKTLELRSQVYASIGIMAGSYAHNIKNLLVRPNDLLRRCLDAAGLPPEQGKMLHEVRQTLGTVTERLQLILRTVRRDPTHSQPGRLELNGLVRDLLGTWEEMAREKWKVALTADLAPGPLPIDGDASHLVQAIENLLFNARDATFELRNRLREEARRVTAADPGARKKALIDAAGWKGEIRVRTRLEAGRVILEVRDNGIGMTDEVRARSTETHFSTKLDNAVYEGHNTGMGLGLSFVVTVLGHHRAGLEIESEPGRGAVFRLSFPPAGDPRGVAGTGRDTSSAPGPSQG